MKSLTIMLIACFGFVVNAYALLTPTVDSIPMSDGRKLAADIYIPSTLTTGPVILIQTPYNRLGYRLGLPLGIQQNLNTSNYIIVVVDWRGYYGSASAAYLGAPSLGNDGYHCVEWIAQQSWCDGHVGTWGPSALGRVQFQTAKTNPPHLTCICPAVAAPQYEYQEYYPNGVLRTEYVDQLDALGFGLTPVLLAHQSQDVVWNYSQTINNYPDSIQVPCLMIGGWYDHTIQFMLPFFNELQTQSPVAVRAQHKLIMGPWVHGGHGTAQVGTALQGQLSYPNALDWDDSLALRFFDYYLRGANNNWPNEASVLYYQMGEDNWKTATNTSFSTSAVNFYLNQNKELTTTLPTNTSGQLSYVYDPNNPSPTIGGPTLRNDLQQGPYDQSSAVESRNDILVFSTPVLTQNAVMKGSAIVHLKVASNKFDTDFDVRLTDVYPDGRSMLVNHGAFRMRFRNGTAATDTAHLQPNQLYDCIITLPASCITFLAGHQIRLDVSSSNYPAFNRNSNTGKAPYPGNSIDSLLNPQVATNQVYCNATAASFITLPLENFQLSVNEIKSNNPLTLTPNPVQAVLQLNNQLEGNYEINIYSMNGSLVLSKPINQSATINIEHLNAGTYLVESKNKASNLISVAKFQKL